MTWSFDTEASIEPCEVYDSKQIHHSIYSKAAVPNYTVTYREPPEASRLSHAHTLLQSSGDSENPKQSQNLHIRSNNERERSLG